MAPCICCGKPRTLTTPYWQVWRWTDHGATKTPAGVCCSIICALRWTMRDAQTVQPYYETYERILGG